MSTLTFRQHQVLVMVANGLRNDEIATELGLKLETVKSHMKNLISELGANNRAHAVAIAMRKGLIG